MRLLVVVSVLLFAIRLWAASHVGFGDSEALYASWATHPQPAYLDHPGLTGLALRAIGEGAAPSPARVHVVTAVLATAIPWLVLVVARIAGATTAHAALAAIVTALVPEIAVGLFGFTPDLLLAPLWLGAIALAIAGLRAPPPPPRSDRARDSLHARRLEVRRAGMLLGAGLLAGIAASAKVSGLLLMAALAVIYAQAAWSREDASATRSARSVWPWAGLGAGIVVITPIVLYEVHLGFPMLRHRFVETQHGAGLALGNLGALAGGQVVYLSPVVAWIAYRIARDLVAERHGDVVTRVLFWTFALPIVPLAILCLWSPHAEPHWIAPPLLALPIHAARRGTLVRARLGRIGAGVAAAMTLAAHAWVLVPSAAALLPSSVDPKADIASELYGWPTAIASVKEQMQLAATPFDPEGREVIVVGPHWTVCAQLHAALPGIRVGCATPIPDDFDRWLPRDEWRRADYVLFVTDNRFPGDGAEQLPVHSRVAQSRVRILRGGRTARTFELYLYARAQRAGTDPLDRGDDGVGLRARDERLRDRSVRPPVLDPHAAIDAERRVVMTSVEALPSEAPAHRDEPAPRAMRFDADLLDRVDRDRRTEETVLDVNCVLRDDETNHHRGDPHRRAQERDQRRKHAPAPVSPAGEEDRTDRVAHRAPREREVPWKTEARPRGQHRLVG